MLNWLFSRKPAAQVPQAESFGIKAAANSQPESIAMGAVDSPGGMTNYTDLGTTREQLRHYRGWQYVAIRAIASRVARQQLHVAYLPTSPAGSGDLKTKAMGIDGLESIPHHPIASVIDDPNEFLTRWSLLYVTVAQLQLTGKAYWWLVNEAGRLKIYPLPPDWVTPDHRGGMYANWIIRPKNSSSEFTVSGDDIAYFNLPNPCDPMGSASPLASQASAVNLDEAIQTAQISTMQNVSKPGMILTVGDLQSPGGQSMPVELTTEQREQLINSVRKAFGGMTKYGSTIILDALIKSVTPFNSSVKDVEFLEGAKSAKSRILQAYGVHEFIVGESAPSSYAQAAAVERVFCDNVVNPILELMGQVLTGWLSPKFEAVTGKLKIWFEPATVLDPQLEFQKWQFALTRDAVTNDEYRSYLGLQPLSDEQAKKQREQLRPQPQLPQADPAEKESDSAAVDATAKAFSAFLSRAVDPYSLTPLEHGQE